jgi:hypothetical protein
LDSADNESDEPRVRPVRFPFSAIPVPDESSRIKSKNSTSYGKSRHSEKMMIVKRPFLSSFVG